MFVEIRGAGFINKGAQLMLISAMQQIKGRYPEAKFVMKPDTYAHSFEKLCEYGFYQKGQYWKKGINFSWMFSLIPQRIRKSYGIVLEREIDVVLDAAGFAYSDQWGKFSCLELAGSAKRWKRYGTKVILLPQAFGPFEMYLNKKGIETIVKYSDMVFAREKVSYDYLIDVVGEQAKIQLAPDFTNLTLGVVPDDFDVENNRVCLVPNYRMVDKTSKEHGEAYLPFMIKCADYLLKAGKKPFILVHEGANDLMLANKIVAGVEGDIPIVKETDPLKIKGILGVCESSIGSRFHGLVSALSQGVPALATGWSHKYQLLYADYEFEEGMLDVLEDEESLFKKLDLLVDDESREQIKAKLQARSSVLKEGTKAMWDQVFAVIDGRTD